MPVTRPLGRALLVAAVSHRAHPLGLLRQLGYVCHELDDPYTAIAELARRPGAYRSIILSLASLYREELAIVQTVKLRFPQVEVWLTQTDGRQSSLAEAMRLGADGLLADDGLHRLAVTPENAAFTVRAAGPVIETAAESSASAPVCNAEPSDPEADLESGIGEPVLTADELRALLQEQPISDRDL